jgi:hypothetical protein
MPSSTEGSTTSKLNLMFRPTCVDGNTNAIDKTGYLNNSYIKAAYFF